MQPPGLPKLNLMQIRKRFSLLTLAMTLLLAAACSSRGPQPVAVAPPPPPPPPEPPSVSQTLPLRSSTLPSFLGITPEPRFDPVEELIRDAEGAFTRGEKDYQEGHLEMAKEEFNDAISAILTAPASLRDDRRLRKTFDSLVDRIHAYELEALKQGDGFAESGYQPAPLDEFQSLSVPEDSEDLPPSERIRAEAAQTVTDIPLVINGQISRLIEYFTSGRGRRALEVGVQGSRRFRDMILRVLEEEEVPLDLFYLAQAESAFRPRARSRAGALGIWQFMPSRGKEYGLNRTWWADERMNPEKATRAAARHLKDLYNQFGDWFLAMAAYNCGPLCVESAVERTGHADYFELASRRALPRETRNYVPIILALTFIGKNAEKYSLDEVAPDDGPWVHDTVAVSHPLDLRLAAEIVGASVETIRDLNPSLLRMTTPNVPEYDLRIPAGTRELFQRRIAMIPPEKWVWWRWHTVHYGETLSGIAREYRTSVKAIAEVNNLDADATLHEAAELVIPVVRPGGSVISADGDETRYRIRRGDTLGAIARRFGVTVDQLIVWNDLNGTLIRAGATLVLYGSDSQRPNTPATRTAAQTHRVRKGDSLWRIARNYNISFEALRRSNAHLGDNLKVGDRVVIPQTQ